MLELPYPIIEQADGTFRFTTDYSIEFSVAFLDASYHFENLTIPNGNIVEFSFEPLSKPEQLPKDGRVSATILKILNSFFGNSQNVLLYVCESTDNKQLARKRTFDRWFDSQKVNSLEKYDFRFVVADVEIVGAIILDIRNTEKELLAALFVETYREYLSYKA